MAQCVCPWCGGIQPDDDLLALHQERFCPNRGMASATAEVSPDAPHENGHRPAAAPQREVATLDRVSDTGIWYPKPDCAFYLTEDAIETVKRVEAMSQMTPRNLLIGGPPGSGKTALARQVAAVYNRPFASIEFGKLQEPRGIFGERLYSPQQGTYYQRVGRFWEGVWTERRSHEERAAQYATERDAVMKDMAP